MTPPSSEPDARNADATVGHGKVLADAEATRWDSALAGKYRRRLALLPPEYRAEHGEEMVQVFLESARDSDPENADLTYRLGSPGWRETSALVVLALRLRWAAPADDSRFAARAAGLRLFTSAVVVLLAAMSLQQTASAIALLIRPPDDWEVIAQGVSIWQTLVPTDDWWLLAQGWVHLVWIAVVVLVGVGRVMALRAAAALAVLPTVVLAVRVASDIAQFGGHGIAAATGWLAVDVAAVIGLVAVASSARSQELSGSGERKGSGGRAAPRDATVSDDDPTRPGYQPGAQQPGSPIPGEFAQPRRLRLHLVATVLAAALGIVYTVIATAAPLPLVAYLVAVPLTDLPTFFALVSVVAAVAALACRRLPRPAAYALAGLASAAALLQATSLDIWIVAARDQDLTDPPVAPFGQLGLTLAITALALDVLVAIVAATLARRTRVRI